MVISPTQHGELKLGMTTHIDSPSYWGTGTRPGVGNVLLRSYYDAQWSRKAPHESRQTGRKWIMGLG